jgi:hypothetical protein
MKTAVLLLNFGEPEHATLEEVVPFLERSFNLNGSLEGKAGEEARSRARRLAADRAPGPVDPFVTEHRLSRACGSGFVP